VFARSHGIGVVFHPNPLDSRVIGALVNKYRSPASRDADVLERLHAPLHPEDFGTCASYGWSEKCPTAFTSFRRFTSAFARTKLRLHRVLPAVT